MPSTAYIFVLTLGLGACSDAVSPNQLLVGSWGSPAAELIAMRAGAELRFECSSVVIDNPIELRDDRTFRVHGEYWTSELLLGDRPEAVLTGSIAGETVVLQMERGPAAGTTYTLAAGVRPQPAEVPACPQ